MELYDKKKIPIKIGDILKVYHFTASHRREKVYMYKQVIGIESFCNGNTFYMISHLDFTKDYYLLFIDGKILDDYEIVQSIKCDHRKRKGE